MFGAAHAKSEPQDIRGQPRSERQPAQPTRTLAKARSGIDGTSSRDPRGHLMCRYPRGRARRRARWMRPDKERSTPAHSHVSDPRGPRCELAKSLLGSGDSAVVPATSSCGLFTSGPRVDGRIRVTVGVGDRAPEASVRDAVRRTHRTVDAVAATDAKFAQLLQAHDPRHEVVHDCGMGTTLIARGPREGPMATPSTPKTW